MQQIIDEIKELQTVMGYTDYINKNADNRLSYGRNISLALVVELVEVLQNVPWKPWKSLFDQKLDCESASKEIADVIVFAVVLHLTFCPHSNLEDDVWEALKKVRKRVENENYGKQGEK